MNEKTAENKNPNQIRNKFRLVDPRLVVESELRETHLDRNSEYNSSRAEYKIEIEISNPSRMKGWAQDWRRISILDLAGSRAIARLGDAPRACSSSSSGWRIRAKINYGG
jgi:hypothetical protein